MQKVIDDLKYVIDLFREREDPLIEIAIVLLMVDVKILEDYSALESREQMYL